MQDDALSISYLKESYCQVGLQLVWSGAPRLRWTASPASSEATIIVPSLAPCVNIEITPSKITATGPEIAARQRFNFKPPDVSNDAAAANPTVSKNNSKKTSHQFDFRLSSL